MPENMGLLLVGGLISGLLAGLLGIGGGTVLVPLLVSLHYSPLQAVATSGMAIALTSISGTVQNWRMGVLDFKRILYLGLPSLITAQVGVYFASRIEPKLLLSAFGCLLILNIFLGQLRKKLERKTSHIPPTSQTSPTSHNFSLILICLSTGGVAGLMAGLFGVGGGVILVPLQVLFLKEPIKVAIQTSLGVIVITAIAAVVGHSLEGNVLYGVGITVGLGGLIGAQISTRYLPKLPEKTVTFAFNMLLTLLSIYSFWQASYS
ncbi:MAG: sulfite exporter TauE/SafE family protein [Microcystaceae cyanobacterium]